MNENATTQTLLPNLTQAFLRVFCVLLAFTAFGAVADRYRVGHWWSADYFASLAIPLLLLPTVVCLMFVPRRIRWSPTEFEVQPRFGSIRALPWTRLYAFGPGNDISLIQFRDAPTFQIFVGAFDREQ